MLDSLQIPIGVAGLSVIVQPLWGFSFRTKTHDSMDRGNGSFSFKRAIEAHGGYEAFGFYAARFVALVALVVLSRGSLGNTECLNGSAIYQQHCAKTLISWTYLYSTLLAGAALVSTSYWRIIASKSVSTLILVTWAVYAYRDIWPLATYSLEPQDVAEGVVLWYKIALLTFVGVVVPLLAPRKYVPVDPKYPMSKLAPEQTASYLSMATYSFLDPLIMLGYHVPHLPADQLPALTDYDDSRHQTRRAFPHMDQFQGAPDRHLFFGLLAHFKKEYYIMVFSIILQAILGAVAPIGLNRTLNYLETRGQGATIRPWFWILWLFVGPVAFSMSEHLYTYINMGARVRMRSILTQLVFEHSLRIRLTADGVREAGTDPGQENTSTKNLLGRINNSVTADAANILEGADFLNLVFLVPLQIAVVMVLLYQILGLSALVALAALILIGPVGGWIGGMVGSTAERKMEKTDIRVQKITEAISVIRMVKLFGWEKRMIDMIYDARKDELKWLLKLKLLEKLTGMISGLLPSIAQWVTYATYTTLMHEELLPSKIFPTLALFNILRSQLDRVSWQYNLIVQGRVSLDRVDRLLRKTELLDAYSSIQLHPSVTEPDTRIGFNQVSYTWSAQGDANAPRSFTLNFPRELVFKAGKINLITGPTGSGKTAILLALLGEMHLKKLSPDSWCNLPREGGVAYASQEGWVLSTTIRQNILFGSPYEEQRYQKVIKQCALDRDLELFEAGDETEVGERGLTLSGGQKARVTLARAVYSRAKILLLDDIFAALDVHTSASIANNCFAGELIRGRTVLIVTHNIPLILPLCEFMVTLTTDGTIATEHVVPSPYKVEDALHEIEDKEQADIIEGDPKPAADSTVGKLVMAEEIMEGHMTWRSFMLLLSGIGGNRPVLFFTGWIAMHFITDFMTMGRSWFLGYWGSQYESHAPAEVNANFYLLVFALLVVASRILVALSDVFTVLGSLQASRAIHNSLITSTITSTLRWLDQTPTSRILARATEDMSVIDDTITQCFDWVMIQVIGLISRTVVITFFTPIFLLIGCVVGILGLTVGNLYLKAQLSVKREMSNALAPVLGHFSASTHGLTSIRAYGAEDAFKQESLTRLNHFVRISKTSFNLNRWVGLRIDALGALLTSLMAAYLVYGKQIGASNTGFSLMFISEFCEYIFWLVRMFNELEVHSNSLERIQAYIDIDHEASPTEGGKPPAAWPASGDLRVENLSARYSKDGPVVLHNLSFHVESGLRVGVVGRTGSGKSSLTLALLRCILTEGEVYYDGLLTNRINLDDLRSKITIIPQMPELLSGTLRQNLDPFGQFDDAVMNATLRASGLYSVQEEGGEGRITLDTAISGGGSNLSVGQRQILALARAMLRESKLLILDEATSAIDYKTDAIIQNTLRHQLDSNVTVITVAHRLHTIMDSDKIMVLDAGQMVEFDTPSNLLRNPKSRLRSLVDNSKDAETLYKKAGITIDSF